VVLREDDHVAIADQPSLQCGKAASITVENKGAPVGRLGALDEIAKASVFLASDDASYITGIELFVDAVSRRCEAAFVHFANGDWP
jgi:NAD(P)-dependent dehydrogenase (short-subunit alcohol dehydrogenase family)